MLKRSFKVKIIIPTVIVLIALVFTLNIFLWVRFSSLSDTLINDQLAANINSLKMYLEESASNSKVASVSMALNPQAIAAVKNRDSYEILRLFTPAVRNMYRVDFFTICDSEGTVLVRTYDTGNAGDSITDQQSVKEALTGKVSTYFEAGPLIRVAVRTASPVYDTDGTLLGVISCGVRFDTDRAVNELKTLFNSEVTVFLDNTRIVTTMTQDGQSIVGTTIDPHIADIVISGRQEYSGDMVIFGERYKTFYQPLTDASDRVFATIFLGIPEAGVIAASNKSIRDGIILGLGGLIISILLLYVIISTISRPIIILSSVMNRIAEGNLRVSIDVKHEDEVGRLGRSLQKVADILHKLLEDINVMIFEQERGNTDYCLNTEEFHGDYKTLADSVLELASFGMRDQLTGLPNRRSFDNRLTWEWERAIRDQSPISILMMDIDKFKTYNDTFGHQQGDVALQTVAATIKQAVKRSIDFAARWGGEEFIVLLPATGSAGALVVAEKIRSDIENAVIPCEDPRGHHETVSIGVTTCVPTGDSSVSGFIAAADAGLYRAKETGRNKVVSDDGV